MIRIQHTARIPTVAPVPPTDEPRLRWSVMVPAYRCSDTIHATLRSALDSLRASGDFYEVRVLIDDPDGVRPYAELAVSIRDPHLSWRANGSRLGAMVNFNECVRRSRGELVHILHGDDVVYPDFYSVVGDAVSARPECPLFVTKAVDVDCGGAASDGGLTLPDSERYAPLYANPFRASAVVVRRSAYEEHGGFDESLPYCGDWEMWVRLMDEAKRRGAACCIIHEVLCGYRQHGESETYRPARMTANLEDFLRVGEAFAARFGERFDREFFRECVRGHAKTFSEIMKRHGYWDGWAACEAFAAELDGVNVGAV